MGFVSMECLFLHYFVNHVTTCASLPVRAAVPLPAWDLQQMLVFI